MPWSTGLSSCKQQSSSRHLLHIFIIKEAPSQHLKDDPFHKPGDQCIPGTDWQSSVLYHLARPLPNQQVSEELRTLSSTHSSAAPLLWHGTAPACTQQTLLWPQQPDRKPRAHRIHSLKEVSAASYTHWRSTQCCKPLLQGVPNSLVRLGCCSLCNICVKPVRFWRWKRPVLGRKKADQEVLRQLFPPQGKHLQAV